MNERPQRKELMIGIGLVVAVLAAYWQVQYHDFIIFDDHQYVVKNLNIQKGLTLESISWAFTTTYASYWHPLTWLSHMLDYQLYGLNPKGHHFNNLLLHMASTLLLFIVLKRMTGTLWRSALVAALFGLHPLRVESVAWVSERKDVLSALFWMLTLLAYDGYVKASSPKRYLIVLLLLAMGLMAKPMLVTLPFAMIFLDKWPYGRIDFSKGRNRWSHLRPLLEKVPFIALGAVSALITFLSAREIGAVPSLDALPLTLRLLNAVAAYATYVGKMFWPVNLSFFHPHPLDSLSLWKMAGALSVLALISLLALLNLRRYPYLLTGWLWYIVTLVPVIGLIQVGGQAIADRFTYLPHIGLYLMVVWGAHDIFKKQSRSMWIPGMLSANILLILLVFTWHQTQTWQNSKTLFRHALRVTKNNYMAHFHLGNVFMDEGDLQRALAHYSEAIKIRPDHMPARGNMGYALLKLGRPLEAISSYAEALRIKPGDHGIHFKMAAALASLGRFDEALVHYGKVIELNPGNYQAHNNMGWIYGKQRRYEEAAYHFKEALKISPNDQKSRYNLEMTLKRMGRESQ
jgi:tetratricopeptide (TPR) repeat protein